ncbi:MAG: DUF2851 family protein, partial [Eudoraea sp.]|nr:DUF2851 family protein [Eudoraea sp.]
MREDLLHYIWKFKKLKTKGLSTSNDEVIKIFDYGTHNHYSGPDFLNARIEIAGQQWAGNVEMHIKASDWYLHNHQHDQRYINVILHVVWINDVPVFRHDRTSIPTLELQHYISHELLRSYNHLFSKQRKNFINCEQDIGQLNSFILDKWLESLFFERLKQRSTEIEQLLKASGNNWERILFLLLLKNFGLKINAEAFMSLGKAIDFSVVLKTIGVSNQLESILFGMAGLLESDTIQDNYYTNLKNEYKYLKCKFNLENTAVLPVEFFKLRPVNFPTIRLSQFAAVYRKGQLFSKIIAADSREGLLQLFQVVANEYWIDHFVFGKRSSPTVKRMTTRFIDLLLINTILPIKFSYARYLGKDIDEALLDLFTEIKVEQNAIITNFRMLGV